MHNVHLKVILTIPGTSVEHVYLSSQLTNRGASFTAPVQVKSIHDDKICRDNGKVLFVTMKSSLDAKGIEGVLQEVDHFFDSDDTPPTTSDVCNGMDPILYVAFG